MSTPDLPVISDISLMVEPSGDYFTARVVSISGKLGIGLPEDDMDQLKGLQALRTRVVNLVAVSRSKRKATVYLLRAIADELEAIR